MSKQYHIRWNESDNKELARVVRNFNAKINRLAKKDPQNKNVLPEKVTVGQLKELINTRRDLNRELNALKRFSKRGAEEIVSVPGTDYNVRLTKWQRTEINRRVGIINRKRKARRDEIQGTFVESRGQEVGYTRGDIGMGKIDNIELSPMNAFTRRMTQYDVSWKWKSVMSQSQSDYLTNRDFILRDNFVRSLEENYNVNDIQDVIDTIKSMDINEFLKEWYKDPEAFEWAYPPDEEQYQGYVNALKSTWLPER